MIAYEINKNSTLTTPVLIAKISAGEPLPAESLIERVDLNDLFTSSEVCLLVRVVGNSMQDVPIFSGDWVMLDRLRHPEVGQIIIAKINGEFTIKRHKTQDNGKRGLFLVPCNRNYKSIKVKPQDDYEILGVVTLIIHPTV